MTVTSESDGEINPEQCNYVRVKEAAAPEAGHALYLNHPEHGWLPVLDQLADIESDHVHIALGDSGIGAFLTLRRTAYCDTEDLIFKTDRALEISEGGKLYPEEVCAADDIVDELPDGTPGTSNLEKQL